MLYKREYIENNKKLKEENKQLKDTIKKAIELVEKADFGSDDNWVARHTGEGIIGAFTMVNTLQENILETLKGVDKE